MAARQDQTLQIFLIIFIFLFLITAVVAYLGWRGYSDTHQTLTKTQTDLSEKSNQMTSQKTDMGDMQEKLGVGRETAIAEVKKTIEEDMKNYGAAVTDEVSRTYRKVLETVAKERDDAAAREAKAKADKAALEKTLLAKETETKKQIDEYDKQRKQAQADLASETGKFAEDRKGLEKTKADLQKSLDDQRTQYEGRIAQLDKEKKDLTEKGVKLADAVQKMIENRKDEPESFEVADGRISWVNQDGTVWINLGTADSLRRQVTFSVFDSDLHDAAKSKKKGSIEVTRLLGEHMAEARITNDVPTNPILTGDNIYSQIWHRGKKLHFALTGMIDFDGDGKSDMDLARELIDLNGGVVDAYLDADGKVQGEITANTRYLVSGDEPDSLAKAGSAENVDDMYKTARSLGVETITLPEFLNQMGYKPQDRTVRLGAGATARDFPATPENDVSGRRSSQFRARPSAETAPTNRSIKVGF
jgi:hypothetical protein